MSEALQAKTVAVIGGGPAGLMAAEVAAGAGARVTIYERMPSLGRKFLLAGRGGLNITHSEEIGRFLTRYGEAEARIAPAIGAFAPSDLLQWCTTLGQATFVGSSGRVFPVGMKTSPLLRAWLRRLADHGVTVRLRHRFVGWEDGRALFETPEGQIAADADAVVLALGGASWPQLGTDGGWVDALGQRGVHIVPLRPANSGLAIAWSEIFKSRFAGTPLKRVALRFGEAVVRGEAVVTTSGIEGGAVYALGAAIRGALDGGAPFAIEMDLKPDETVEQLTQRLARPKDKRTLKEHLRKQLNLAPVAIGLIQEVATATGIKPGELYAADLAKLVKAVPVRIAGAAPIARAISTAGGIALGEIDDGYMLKKLPGVFVAGEMLDWEAPTGGYLLQACFSTGAAAGRGAVAWISRGSTPRGAPPDRSPTGDGTLPGGQSEV